MSWKDRLIQASFKGVPFFVKSHEFGPIGRSLIEHRYINSDFTTVQDIGREPRRWSIDGYIVGNDYDVDRDALIRAFEERGWGNLTHPYLGEIDAYGFGLTVTEVIEEGRMCRFRCSFLERLFFPDEIEKENPRQKVILEAEEAMRSVEPSDIFKFSPRQFIAAMVKKITDFIRRFDAIRQLADEMLTIATDVVDGAFEIYGTLREIYNKALDFFNKVDDAIAFYFGLFRTEDSAIPGNGFYSRRQRDQERAFLSSARFGAAMGIARSSALDDYRTVEQAAARREELVQVFDELREDDQLRSEDLVTINQVQGSAVDFFRSVEEDLPSIYEYQEQGSTGLQIASRFYNDTGKMDEVIALSKISNPLLVSGLVRVRV